MKGIPGIAAVSLAMATSSVAAVEAGTHSDMHALAQGGWVHMVSLEPCMNGAVSASGLYPSQIAEDMSFSTRGVMAGLNPE